MDWAYTNGGASGAASVTLNHPSLVAGGTYEARLYANDGYTLLAKSAPFVLNPAGPVVAVTSTQAVKGGSITVKWSGIASPTPADWIGIYAVGSDDYAYLDWAYTNGGSSGTVNVTLNHPGIVAGNTYEARLYANDGYTLITKTAPFTVVANTGQSTPAALYYYHNDHLGTPQALTNQAGVVVWRATYDPFGKATVTTSTITNNLRYAGQYFDAETGLHYNWNRYYDPKIGRYISSDPIGLAGGLNTYAYVDNNPLRWIDPEGLAKMCCRLLNSWLPGTVARQRHCYIVADDGTVYGLYPSGGKGVPGTNHPDDKGGECFDCPALECSNQDQCLRNAHNNYPVGDYDRFGPNSNTYAGTLAGSCCKGGIPSGVSNAPGVGDKPPSPPKPVAGNPRGRRQ
jgi:RHS repeat-associated protein